MIPNDTKMIPNDTVKCVILVSVKVRLGITLLTDITTLRVTKKAVNRLSFLFAETVKINIKTSKIFYKTIDIRINTCYNIFRS